MGNDSGNAPAVPPGEYPDGASSWDLSDMFRLLVANLKDSAILLLDAEARVVLWNAGARHLLGHAASDIVGVNHSVFFPREDLEKGVPDALVREALSQGRSTHEGTFVRKDGSWFHANMELTAIHEPNGQVRGFCVIVRDQSERGRSEMLLRSVLDNVIDGIIVIDSHGTVQSANRAAERLFGRTEAEMIGQNVKGLMPEPFRSQHDAYIANYLSTGLAKIIGIGREVKGRRPDGSTFPMDLAVSEFQLDGRRFFTGIVRDITDRKAMEDQLRQSQKMEAIGQLAGGVAHDFNNLLTIITGYSNMVLARMSAVDPSRPFMCEVLAAGERAISLTRQLLAFSRQSVIEARVIDVGAQVRETEKMLRRMIGEDIELVTVLDAGASYALMDAGQFVQVVMNLAVNARDAMPQGGKLSLEVADVTIDDGTARLYADAKPGRYVVISVTDTGIGMTPEVRNRIFEPFFTTKGLGKGTGLGLAVVHGIVRQSGGFIEVYSELNYGSVFKVFLPAVRRGTAPVTAGDEAISVRHGTETILLVEDEASVRDIVLLILKEHGYNVLTASGGIEALRIAAQHRGGIDMLVTDVVMPEMSGRQLSEHLREKIPAIKVLFLSGYTDDAVVRHGILQQDVAFLQKPFTANALARKVREVLDKS